MAMQRILMIAYHFPPLAGSSGIQRTLRFVQHLPSCGWQPIVLSADPRAYERTSEDLLPEIPAGVTVRRAFALDTARQLAIGGRYFGWMARPDRWISWRFDAVRQGMALIREYRPQVIWSTYPIATAHLIGAELQRRSGLPWIADFRDPMAQDGYPADPRVWRAFKEIETTAVNRASFSTFTTPGAVREYRQRFPAAATRIHLLENGYDEESFAGVDPAAATALRPSAITLLHSGIVYPDERDPTALFVALGRLVASGSIDPQRFRIRFRASAHDEHLQALARQHGAADCIELLPAVGYREALAEMTRADGLLVLQAANCNDQIPAKVYEYLRARRPILCLTDPAGDTAGVLRNAGLDAIARLDSADEIATALLAFIARVAAGSAAVASDTAIAAASRRGRTAALAELLAALPRT